MDGYNVSVLVLVAAYLFGLVVLAMQNCTIRTPHLVKMCIVDDYAIEQLEHREVCTMYVDGWMWM